MPPQFWFGFYGWCAMCWNEWKINFPFFRFYLFLELLWKFIENWEHFCIKMIITWKIYIRKIWNLIFLSIQLIPDLSCKFEHFWKKKWGKKNLVKNVRIFLNKIFLFPFNINLFLPLILPKVIKFTWMMRNQLNRKKNQISDFSNFNFSGYGHFCLFSSLISEEFFTMTQKRKNRVKTGGGGSAYP